MWQSCSFHFSEISVDYFVAKINIIFVQIPQINSQLDYKIPFSVLIDSTAFNQTVCSTIFFSFRYTFFLGSLIRIKKNKKKNKHTEVDSIFFIGRSSFSIYYMSNKKTNSLHKIESRRIKFIQQLILFKTKHFTYNHSINPYATFQL